MSRSQVSALPTFSEQIGQKLSYHHDEVVITVEPFMLEKMVSLLMESWLKSSTI